MKKGVIVVNNREYPLKIIYHNKNTVRGYIKDNMIVFKFPVYLNKFQRYQSELKLKAWAKKVLKKNQDLVVLPKTYKNNDIVKVLGRTFLLKINRNEYNYGSAMIDNNEIILTVPYNLEDEQYSNFVKKLICKAFARKMQPYIEQKVNELNNKHFKVNINKVRLKNMKRWGSCSSKRNINLSVNILMAPEDVIDYVCVHELAHLIEMNHSKKFWKLVEKVMPDYKDKVLWLKQNSGKCRF